jgi:TRAP-type C4-dicarboxylate transport system permease small subunit
VSERLRGAIDAGLDAVDVAAKWAIVAAMAAMVAIVSTQVGLRYLFNSSIGWADEVSRLAFVWSIFLAIPIGVRAKAHIGIDLLANLLPGALRDALGRAVAAASAGLMAAVGWYAYTLAADQWDEKMASLEFSASWFVVAVCVGAAHSCAHLLRLAAFGPWDSETPLLATE